jgi:hypothetical protein
MHHVKMSTHVADNQNNKHYSINLDSFGCVAPKLEPIAELT